MEIPRFEKNNVNPRLITSDMGDAFQTFVHELLLQQYPNLHRFPGGGKDGGIDLIDTTGSCRVVECKLISVDDYSEIERRWKVVRTNLEAHLRHPDGPTKGQSQYGPWYSTQSPITEYIFCVSALLANEQQRRDLQKTIADFFEDIAQRPHLSHLGKLRVSIEEWNGFSSRLLLRPHLVFRWFPSTRPTGLVPLDEAVPLGTFRSYLTSGKLPYYSLAEHLRVVPEPSSVNVLNEESLLRQFDDPEITGLVITGKGGVGKSRLSLELGWLALRNSWSVMRVQTRLKEGALEALAERLTPQTQALLLVDYIETQDDFGEMVESLNLLNDSGVATLRYVAACRTGYYHRAIAATGRHFPVDLTPPPGAAAVDWFAQYRRHAVSKILETAGLPVTEQYLTVCRDLPILAVFLVYLHDAGRTEDLAELLREVEFGRWVARRIQLSFATQDVSRRLALLVPLFPMTDSAARQLPSDLFRTIFDRLATDGWIEKLPANATELPNSWVTAHDVLADQVLLSYARSIPNTTQSFIAQLFPLAVQTGSLASTLVSLQRVADTPPLNAIPWANLIREAIANHEFAWREVRDLVGRTTLLSVSEHITLLEGLDGMWVNAEQDDSFQKQLGWLARWAVTHHGDITEQQKKILVTWISKTVPLAETSNFVITWGLRLAPAIVQEAAFRWISTRPAFFQTHYLMVAWLDTGFSADLIGKFVEQWCQHFARRFHLSFLVVAWLEAGGEKALVQDAITEWLIEYKAEAEARFVYKAWLEGGGEKTLVEDAIREWLIEHKTLEAASHVYKAWLDAGGDKRLVRDPLEKWLVKHGEESEADHVFRSWLEAGGERASVWGTVLAWLATHRTEESAVYVTKFIARQRDLSLETVKDVLGWCRAFPNHEDALWRLTQLGENLFIFGVEHDLVLTAERVLFELLQPTSCPKSVTRGQISALISYLIDSSQLLTGTLRKRVDVLFVKWLRHPLSYGRDPKPHPQIQRFSYLRRLSLLIDDGLVDIEKDHEPLTRFIAWFEEWDANKKQRALVTLDEIRDRNAGLFGILADA